MKLIFIIFFSFNLANADDSLLSTEAINQADLQLEEKEPISGSELNSIILNPADIQESIIEKEEIEGDVGGHLWVVENGKLKKYLFANEIDINVSDEYGRTGLMYVAIDGDFKMIKYLSQNGADIFAKDKDGKTAYTHALENGNIQIAAYLLHREKKELSKIKIINYDKLKAFMDIYNLYNNYDQAVLNYEQGEKLEALRYFERVKGVSK